MTAAYDVWRGAMYCVGVFVTCNVGGMVLRWSCSRVSGLMRRRAVTAGASGNGNAVREWNAQKWNAQSFEDIQREIRADAERDRAETESVTPS